MASSDQPSEVNLKEPAVTLLTAVVVLCVVVALVVAVGAALVNPSRSDEATFVDSQGTGEVESPLLRRPLRSRID